MSIERQYTMESAPEDCVCAQFGCGKHLTLDEQLAGNYCMEHTGKEYRLVGHAKAETLRSVLTRVINSKLK